MPLAAVQMTKLIYPFRTAVLLLHVLGHTKLGDQINLSLAGPAVFRGRLRRFGKCTNGVALSKGTPNLASVRLTLLVQQYFTPPIMKKDQQNMRN